MAVRVQQQRNQRIAMTATVTQQGEADTWNARFITKKWTMETLPIPNNDCIKLRLLPARAYQLLNSTPI